MAPQDLAGPDIDRQEFAEVAAGRRVLVVALRCTGPVPPRPISFSGPRPKIAFSQFRFIGMYSALVCGLNAIARQLLNPAVLGHMSICTPISGILPGR